MSRLFEDASSENLENSNALITQRPWCQSAWFFLDSLPTVVGDEATFGCGDTVAGSDLIACSTRDEAGADLWRLRVLNAAGDGRALTTNNVFTNIWHHGYCEEISSTLRRAVLDADFANEGVDTTSVVFPAMNVSHIGAAQQLTIGRHMDGRIAEVAIWNGYACTNAQILALSKGASPFEIGAPLPTHFWPLWGLNSPEVDLGLGTERLMTLSSASIDPDLDPPFARGRQIVMAPSIVDTVINAPRRRAEL